MDETSERLKKQAQWQRGRRDLPWPEKIRLVEAIRDSLESLRRARADPSRRPRARTSAGSAVPAERPDE
jgi:hypothetical protein